MCPDTHQIRGISTWNSGTVLPVVSNLGIQVDYLIFLDLNFFSCVEEAVLRLCRIAVPVTIPASFPLNARMTSHLTTPENSCAFPPIPKGRGGGS